MEIADSQRQSPRSQTCGIGGTGGGSTRNARCRVPFPARQKVKVDVDFHPQDWALGLDEVMRLVQFYNFEGIAACEGSEDGYCSGAREGGTPPMVGASSRLPVRQACCADGMSRRTPEIKVPFHLRSCGSMTLPAGSPHGRGKLPLARLASVLRGWNGK